MHAPPLTDRLHAEQCSSNSALVLELIRDHSFQRRNVRRSQAESIQIEPDHGIVATEIAPPQTFVEQDTLDRVENRRRGGVM